MDPLSEMRATSWPEKGLPGVYPEPKCKSFSTTGASDTKISSARGLSAPLYPLLPDEMVESFNS